MFDIKISRAVIIDVFLGFAGVLFLVSDEFSHGLGVTGFFKRIFAAIICFVGLAVVTYIATRN